MSPVLVRVWSEGRTRTTDGVALVLGGLALLVAGDDEGFVMCPFRRCTGGNCPLCGTTRSAASLARFDLHAAWARHPVVVLALAQVITFAILHISGRALSQGLRQRILVGNALLALVVWGARLAAGHIPAPNGLQLPF